MIIKRSLSVSLALAVLVPPIVKASIFSQTDVKLTFYYDIGDRGKCGSSPGDPVVAGWADLSGMNAGTTYCEQQRGKPLNQIGTNRIVAFDQDKVWADPTHWCGREVKVYGPDGKELLLSEGPFYIWDSCQNCAGGGKILDVSGEAFVDAKGGTCGGNNPEGYRYDVMDNYIVDPSVGLGGSSGGTGGSTVISAASIITSSAPASTLDPLTPSSVAHASSSSAILTGGSSTSTVAPSITSSAVVYTKSSQTTSIAATTKHGGWREWTSHPVEHGNRPAASVKPLAELAESENYINTTESGKACKRVRKKRRLAKQ
ncbi:uncharacterized protein I206_103777 [Kwoniella pini CBS 10737]|uniref:Barwin domain-containing protein n=1 Tax=Kwoniella pini CBS 10737 TaxID=1296096 RepID=A0A1B9HSJ4_9TREE|nr:uncharacterized protein I206_07726 [Kwoniella pini CBS 10737]OCF46249.1 hypothetical protein I206_07726 [Kwoniella pini CBS 10737]